MTTSDSPLKTRSDRIETSPPKKTESKESDGIQDTQETKPEETLIFSEMYDNFQTEPKSLPIPVFNPSKKSKKLPQGLDYRLPTFGDDDGEDSVD